MCAVGFGLRRSNGLRLVLESTAAPLLVNGHAVMNQIGLSRLAGCPLVASSSQVLRLRRHALTQRVELPLLPDLFPSRPSTEEIRETSKTHYPRARVTAFRRRHRASLRRSHDASHEPNHALGRRRSQSSAEGAHAGPLGLRASGSPSLHRRLLTFCGRVVRPPCRSANFPLMRAEEFRSGVKQLGLLQAAFASMVACASGCLRDTRQMPLGWYLMTAPPGYGPRQPTPALSQWTIAASFGSAGDCEAHKAAIVQDMFEREITPDERLSVIFLSKDFSASRTTIRA